MAMIKIRKKYHFYAAHRNPAAGEKCGRIHGHLYRIFVEFNFTEMVNGVTMLFSDIDKVVEPIIKSHDHMFLLHDKDPIKDALDYHNEPYYEIPFESSAENMAIWIFNQIKRGGLPITRIELQETETSTVIYEENE